MNNLLYERFKFGNQRRKRRGEWVECETCGRLFYVPPSRIRQATRQGTHIRYCNMVCYDRTGDKNPFWGKKHSEKTKQRWVDNPGRSKFDPGTNNPNATAFGPDFRGKTIGWWKQYLLRTIGHCERCGYLEHIEIIEIHHIDRNRRHNTRDNLILLCPICHELDHFNAKDGKHKRRK